MRKFLDTLTARIEASPGGAPLFAAVIGGLFGLMVLNVAGGPHGDLAAWLPVSAGQGEALKAGGEFVVFLQLVGASIAWLAHHYRRDRRA